MCAVVKQGSETKSCQFSWWCDGRSDSVQEEVPYAMAKEIARKALNKQLPDRTKGALYFHDRTVKPDWAREYTQHGGHRLVPVLQTPGRGCEVIALFTAKIPKFIQAPRNCNMLLFYKLHDGATR